MNKIYSIVFCCDGGYGQYLIVALESLYKHCSPLKQYEINIIDCGLDEQTIQTINFRIKNFNNITLNIQRFDSLYQNNQEIYYANDYISSASYARFFLARLTNNDFILYLDVDISIECDVAEIIDNHKPSDKLITATPDIGMEICRRYAKGWIAYFNNIIQLDYDSKNHYFNAGVLIINRHAWVAQNIEEKLMQFLTSDRKFHLFDQDVLNIVCFGQVQYLDFRYNVMASEYKVYKNYNDDVLDRLLTAFLNAANSSNRIIHYTTSDKPWCSSNTKLATSWWQSCRQTPVYEQCIFNLMKQGEIGKRQISIIGLPLFKVKQDSSLYKLYFCKINIFGWKKKKNIKTYYLLNLPIIKIKYQ